MSATADDIDAALQARAATGGGAPADDIDAALHARAKQRPPAPTPDAAPLSAWDSLKKRVANVYGSYLEPAATAITGAVAKPVSDVAGLAATGYDMTTGNPDTDAGGFKRYVQDRLTYTPRTEAGAQANSVAKAVSSRTLEPAIEGTGNFAAGYYGGAADLLGASRPVSEAVQAAAREGTAQGVNLMGARTAKPAAALDVPAAAEAAAQSTASRGSMGAAGTAVDVSKLSPETRAELAQVYTNQKRVNPIALANHVEAESLPVPVRMTRGQALDDANLKSQEFNKKGQNDNAIGQRYDEQDAALRGNLDEFHRDAAPSAVGNTEVQNGHAVIDSLKRYDAPIKEEIDNAYTDARDSNKAEGKGDLKLNTQPIIDHASDVLKDREDLLPAEARSRLQAIRDGDGTMSVQQLETYKTITARATRKAEISGDGNAVAALSDFRDALEKADPVDGTSAAVQAKFNKARSLAKSRFDEMDQDPAYKAAANDDTPEGVVPDIADKFNNKYVINGTKSNLQRLRAKLDDEGNEAMTSSAFNLLKEKAGTTKDKFLQDGYNTTLQALRQKKGTAEELFGGPDRVEDLSKLGRVAGKVQARSRGDYSNSSHTFVSAAASDIVGMGSHLLPKGINTALGVAKSALGKRAIARSIDESLKPGAGLGD